MYIHSSAWHCRATWFWLEDSIPFKPFVYLIPSHPIPTGTLQGYCPRPCNQLPSDQHRSQNALLIITMPWYKCSFFPYHPLPTLFPLPLTLTPTLIIRPLPQPPRHNSLSLPQRRPQIHPRLLQQHPIHNLDLLPPMSLPLLRHPPTQRHGIILVIRLRLSRRVAPSGPPLLL